MKKINLSEELNNDLQDFLAKFKSDVERKVLTDILCRLYFLDCNKECNYSKMQASDIVKIYHKELAEIEDAYSFDLATELDI